MGDISATRFPAASLVISMAIFGTVGLFATEAGLHPITTVFWRCIFATLFLAGWCFLRGYLPDRTLSISRISRAAIGGICNILSAVALFWAFQTTTIATATIVYHTQPFFVVLIGVICLKDRIQLHQVLWMTGAFAGVALAAGLFSSSDVAHGSSGTGTVLSVVAALLYAVGTILGKGLGGQRPEVTTLIQTVIGAAMLAPFADIFQPVPLLSWGWLVGLGVIHTGIAYVLMYSAYPRLSTPVIGVLAFIYPVVAIIVDRIAYARPIELPQAAGIILIVLGTLGIRLGWRLPIRSASVG